VDITVSGITKLETLDSARIWLERFFDELQKINVPANSALVRSVLEYVREHVTEGLVLENVAAMFYVSPNHLSTLIRKETGITYRQHVINAKIAVAKQMLDDTRMRVEDIAYAIGYENYISFYNVFRKMEGISPTEYRFSKTGD
jgi:YesN/AraC family two-component response regulator